MDRQDRKRVGRRFEILYSGEKNSRNRVGVILSPEFKEKVVEVSRPSSSYAKPCDSRSDIQRSVSTCPREWRNREDKGGVFERLGRSDVESAENREDCSRS